MENESRRKKELGNAGVIDVARTSRELRRGWGFRQCTCDKKTKETEDRVYTLSDGKRKNEEEIEKREVSGLRR